MKPFVTGHSVPQTDPPRSPRETLPDMYDLPSEYPEEPGLPDEFHDLQPQLLSRTLALKQYTQEEWFTGSDLNVYYDVHHPLWHKRPDWFLAVGVPRLYNGHDLRRSYVTWQEGRNPHVVIEFLSPGTEQEDLGRFYGVEARERSPESPSALETATTRMTDPPPKFVAYEQFLRIPHYLVYHRPTQKLRYFQFAGGRYHEQPILETNPKVWLADLEIGLGVWQGFFEGLPGKWLRWCDQDGTWLLTDTEQERLAKEQEQQARVQAQQETQQAQQETQQAQQEIQQVQSQVIQAAKNLLATGMPFDQVTELLGLSAEQIDQLR